jgi:succinyl-CoA synthetase beta subunit
MDGCMGAINTFVVEPFVPHAQEYYLSIQVCPHARPQG